MLILMRRLVWAVSSGSALFAKVSSLVHGADKVKMCILSSTALEEAWLVCLVRMHRHVSIFILSSFVALGDSYNDLFPMLNIALLKQ